MEMGMFDTIKDKIFCPYCGHLSKENEFQSKSMSCLLDSWTISDMIEFQDGVIEFHGEYEKCKKWIVIQLECGREKYCKEKLKERIK